MVTEFTLSFIIVSNLLFASIILSNCIGNQTTVEERANSKKHVYFFKHRIVDLPSGVYFWSSATAWDAVIYVALSAKEPKSTKLYQSHEMKRIWCVYFICKTFHLLYLYLCMVEIFNYIVLYHIHKCLLYDLFSGWVSSK